ncbi:thiol-disulfide oxidoreductase [Bacillus mycoides]|uniref:DUF393 domain-containing protein n=1 Tax=Bacillus thuringiensis TaxID=1428 RepID=A0AB36TNX0_BACTU|nr:MULTISPECIES: DCC1-like thiol-disulfide oxidoreductase family protein [Bacillus cereus group]MBZ3766588.1 DCC1-like thiol-disulfide oxidoreductase family protein [Bacillus cereus]MBG9721774.1 thiol-disulfide oxidoreductase [Bacillus mycoides]MBJ8018423.1 DUF393 domain-containing protein [Bacillus cereus group sp. N34]MCP9225153.1 DCC1-like thiol-disulfide oxidoreductase family protein [Bacillus mycoides]OOR66719.1 thiol-disulfide oxidoreductase [Bacillus mycoides]
MCGIILFDGDCNFCNQSVQFIIKRDSLGYFRYVSLQGDIGQRMLKQYKINLSIDSIVLIDNDKSYIKSDAIINICKRLSGPWKMMIIFLVIPRSIRNLLYEKFAERRYKWFGKQTICLLPPPEIRKRFLD